MTTIESIDEVLIHKKTAKLSNYTFIYLEEAVKILCYAICNKYVEELKIVK